MTTEVDFAMQYADERRMRMQLETRLLGLLYDSMALIAACGDTGVAVLRNRRDNDSSSRAALAKNLIQMLQYAGDMLPHVFLTTFDHKGEHTFFHPADMGQDAGRHDLGDLPGDKLDAMQHAFFEAAKDCRKQWDEIANRYNVDDSSGLRQNVGKQVAATIEEESGEKQSRQTH